jgi:hypothetical protein
MNIELTILPKKIEDVPEAGATPFHALTTGPDCVLISADSMPSDRTSRVAVVSLPMSIVGVRSSVSIRSG